MSLATTLMAVGLPGELANRVGYQDRVPLDGNGTTQGTATEIIETNTNVALGTSVGDTAFILPEDAEYFLPYFVLNTTAETALVFPPVGDTIDAGALNEATEIPEDTARIFYRVEEGRWVSFNSGAAIVSTGNTVIVTAAGTVVVAVDTGALILNKAAPSATPVELPSVADREGLALTIVDFAGNAGDITITPDGAETIMGLSSATLVSNGQGLGLAATVTLVPNVDLNGWYQQ